MHNLLDLATWIYQTNSLPIQHASRWHSLSGNSTTQIQMSDCGRTLKCWACWFVPEQFSKDTLRVRGVRRLCYKLNGDQLPSELDVFLHLVA